jgi:pyridoxine 4-dehydrogenase
MPSKENLAELPVGQIGFGAMRITGPGVWGPPRDEDEAIALLRRAVEKGVSFIDTADSYGPSVSETLIAKALYPYPAGWSWPPRAGLYALDLVGGSPIADPSSCAALVRTA